jgi:hypothetical protein
MSPALTTVRHLADPVPLPLQRLFRRLHAQISGIASVPVTIPAKRVAQKVQTRLLFPQIHHARLAPVDLQPQPFLDLLFDPALQTWPLIASQHDKVVGSSAPVWRSPTVLVHRPDGTVCRTNAGIGSQAEAISPLPAAFPVSSGATCPARPFHRPVPRLEFPATSGSASVRSGPPLASADKPSGSSADLSLRAAPSHPGKSGDCLYPLLHRRCQASSKSGGLSTSIA